MLERYYIEKEKQEKLLSRKNIKSDFYNGIYDRYEYPVLTREHIPLTWRYDLNPETNPYFMERLGINAVMNSGAIELNGKYYLVARIEGNDRKSFFGVAESDNGVDGFRFWDYPILLDDTCPEETNVYDMRLTKHEDGYIYGVFCPLLMIKGRSESHDTMQISQAPVSFADLQEAYLRLLDGQPSEAAFDWKEGDVRDRRFLKYSFLDEDHITEYLQTGHAFNRDTMVLTGREFNR